MLSAFGTLEFTSIEESSMAQGFGRGPKRLGYVLLLLPQVHAYAASPSLREVGQEELLGITDSLELARRWRKKRGAHKAIFEYLSAFEEEVAQDGTHEIVIERLEQLESGELRTSVESRIVVSRELVE